MDCNAAVVIDEAQLAELVHEKTDAGARRADHFRKRILPKTIARLCRLTVHLLMNGLISNYCGQSDRKFILISKSKGLPDAMGDAMGR